MFYSLWITLAVVSCVIAAIFAKQVNNTQSIQWFALTIIWQLFSVWPLIAKYSKNLLFDALIYDVIILLAYYGTLLFLGTGRNFTLTQWLALGIISIGLVIFKLSGS